MFKIPLQPTLPDAVTSAQAQTKARAQAQALAQAQARRSAGGPPGAVLFPPPPAEARTERPRSGRQTNAQAAPNANTRFDSGAGRGDRNWPQGASEAALGAMLSLVLTPRPWPGDGNGHGQGGQDDDNSNGDGFGGSLHAVAATGSDHDLDCAELARLLPAGANDGIFDVVLPGGRTLGVVVSGQSAALSYLLSPAPQTFATRLRRQRMELEERMERLTHRNVNITVL